jgi:Tfp pilus assembly protein FimT
MLELVMVLLITAITAAFAVPIMQQTVYRYQLKGAVASVTWAIQSTRFQALTQAYPYQVTFTTGATGSSPTFQVADEPIGATSYTNVGSSIPLSGRPVVLGATTVFQFQPNGTIATSPTSAAPYSLTLAYQGTTETITISTYGNVDVTP